MYLPTYIVCRALSETRHDTNRTTLKLKRTPRNGISVAANLSFRWNERVITTTCCCAPNKKIIQQKKSAQMWFSLPKKEKNKTTGFCLYSECVCVWVSLYLRWRASVLLLNWNFFRWRCWLCKVGGVAQLQLLQQRFVGKFALLKEDENSARARPKKKTRPQRYNVTGFIGIFGKLYKQKKKRNENSLLDQAWENQKPLARHFRKRLAWFPLVILKPRNRSQNWFFLVTALSESQQEINYAHLVITKHSRETLFSLTRQRQRQRRESCIKDNPPHSLVFMTPAKHTFLLRFTCPLCNPKYNINPLGWPWTDMHLLQPKQTQKERWREKSFCATTWGRFMGLCFAFFYTV